MFLCAEKLRAFFSLHILQFQQCHTLQTIHSLIIKTREKVKTKPGLKMVSIVLDKQ